MQKLGRVYEYDGVKSDTKIILEPKGLYNKTFLNLIYLIEISFFNLNRFFFIKTFFFI